MGGTIVKLEDDACTAVEDLEEPEAEEECSAEKECETYDWITTPCVGCKDEGEGEASPTVCGLEELLSPDLLYVVMRKEMLSKWSLQMMQWEIMQQILETPPKLLYVQWIRSLKLLKNVVQVLKKKKMLNPPKKKRKKLGVNPCGSLINGANVRLSAKELSG